MTDKQRTCGDCAWFNKSRMHNECEAPFSLDVSQYRSIGRTTNANTCLTFRSHADQALIDECHKLRSLGAAVEWAKIDRLVEIAAGMALDGKKRCSECEGIGHLGVMVHTDGNLVGWVNCETCHGTGYQKGGDE